MAGQNQIYVTNQSSLYDKYNKRLISHVKSEYIKDKYAINSEIKPINTLHTYLLKEAYSSCSKEIGDWIKDKLQGEILKIQNKEYNTSCKSYSGCVSDDCFDLCCVWEQASW